MADTPRGKASHGRFLEDFSPGQVITHAPPRTITRGDSAVYNSIYGDRHALHCSDRFARSCGLEASPVHDLLVFHIIFGMTVGDLSLNAIANLGYAEGRFLRPVHYGDTLHARSTLIGIKENSNGRTGIIWVKTTGLNQEDEPVLTYKRWVMVRKRDTGALSNPATIPTLKNSVSAADLPVPRGLDFRTFDTTATGESYRLGDYAIGETIEHIDCATLNDTEPMLATRLYQNTARVHFDVNARPDGRRLIYGGHLISQARALSCNGLANAQLLLAINGGSHVNPAFAGDTVTGRTTVIEQADHPSPSAGAIRLRTQLGKVDAAASDPYDDANLLLDLDYWCLMPA